MLQMYWNVLMWELYSLDEMSKFIGEKFCAGYLLVLCFRRTKRLAISGRAWYLYRLYYALVGGLSY